MEDLSTINIKEQSFSLPLKRIYDSQSTFTFQSSIAIYRLKYYLHKYINMVHNVEIPDLTYVSEITIVNEMSSLLTELSNDIDTIPPFEGPRRYGNLACRNWHSLIDSKVPLLLEKVLGCSNHATEKGEFEKLKGCIIELNYYLCNSLGSATRLDYGTGHELSFLAVIAAMDMLGLWTENFKGVDLLHMFHCYYELVKKLIVTYTLEPAGSHGVWGLDDHFHLSYILGSSQLSENPNPPFSPSDIINKKIVTEYMHKNFYCYTIDFIYKVKSGPFSEHSPILYDISTTVNSWLKVNSGLVKMYMVEVLNKFPVVQHFWFGEGFYPWKNVKTHKLLDVYMNDTNQENNVFNSSDSSSIPNNAMNKDRSVNQNPSQLNRIPQNRYTAIPVNNRDLRRPPMGPPSSHGVENILQFKPIDRFRRRR
ncbi:hypothetical protein TPHA_0D04650 [Tetrapisispora phaffii CBS 4417]|uniref:Serine/threonine-protein phosphatase 2A activator n=1 Tax=Tetrapisispora phaffii (strain ATCC 24235 / CBS 4417 / NBRC 1672 / NRRL Y-8282 / UCD 70-5) TaxID=1071381 RepID=G8BS24_TETPH|nr:hypothetical protein TPHA_0D04650 [Tetrapisispora phaffii CBS 4417]CCE63099.1 hypothetical protein TPHA_0D04650 [Tetrapisispora phaffii CBS 4417]